ncbi:MAG: methyltransferase family protein [Bacteroidetes bacterium]|nr:methyltransferase family protein [Bacteroidota bacterium]
MDNYKITFQTWNKVAALYQEKFMDFDLYNDTYDRFCELISKREAAIFEIGCGPGNITKYLLAKRPDFKIEAIDVAPNMIALAKENNPAANFRVMDCRGIDRLAPGFDAIMCGFCIPYLSKTDCAKLLKDSAGLLNNNGIIYFSTIEGDYERSGFEKGSSGDSSYVYYYSEQELREMLKNADFEEVEIIRKPFQKPDETPSIHLIFIVRKK